jgi:cholesterol transport system auxiliary component
MTNRIDLCQPRSQSALQRLSSRSITAGAALAALLLAGCAAPHTETAGLYDFGLLPAASTPVVIRPLPALSIADPTVPTWLDRHTMTYRLAYANDLQPHAYASSRWSSTPLQLFAQRLKARIGQTGSMVVPASDGAVNILTLHIEADDFSQVFSSPTESFANISLRAAVLRERVLVAQKTFSARTPAPTPDAQGGVRALSQASDAVIDDMTRWLATLPLQK